MYTYVRTWHIYSACTPRICEFVMLPDPWLAVMFTYVCTNVHNLPKNDSRHRSQRCGNKQPTVISQVRKMPRCVYILNLKGLDIWALCACVALSILAPPQTNYVGKVQCRYCMSQKKRNSLRSFLYKMLRFYWLTQYTVRSCLADNSSLRKIF